MDRGSDKIKKNIGRRGENLACKFLMDRGHTILEHNWRYGYLEIDLITYDSEGIHFVEVKTRTAPVQADPQDCVDRVKQKRIAKAAAGYLSAKGSDIPQNAECRFDIIAVTFDGERKTIEYFPEAFFPMYINI